MCTKYQTLKDETTAHLFDYLIINQSADVFFRKQGSYRCSAIEQKSCIMFYGQNCENASDESKQKLVYEFELVCAGLQTACFWFLLISCLTSSCSMR